MREPVRRPTAGPGLSLAASPLAAAAVLLLAACGDGEPAPSMAEPAGPAERQTAFRVRADFDAGLNGDAGWAAAIDEPATIVVDRPFRLRVEAVADRDGAARRYRLDVRRNDGDWQPLQAEDFPYPLKTHEVTADAAWRFARGGESQLRRSREDGEAFWRVETGAESLLALADYTIGWQPAEFGAEIRLPDRTGARAGIVFDHPGDGDFSALELIRPDTVRLIRVDGGQTSLLAEREFDLAHGRWVAVSLALNDDGVTVEIGDEALAFSQPLPAPPTAPRLGLFIPPNGLAHARSLVVEAEASTPRSSIVSARGFEHGAPTRDLLPGSDRPFTGGAGVSLFETTPAWTPDGGHGEWAFPIVIRRFADEAALNEAGDRFDYRLVEVGGEPLPAAATASVRIEVPDGHVGGTFVETPMRIGPWQAGNGDLYFVMEPSETWNRMMIVRSSDGGRSWREVDGANRPETGDLEGVGTAFVDGRIHILHQVSDEVLYHAFDTVDRGDDPDRWAVRDQHVAAPPQPPTQVADIAVRSDGSLVAIYGSADGVRIATRAPDGPWSEAHRIDGPGDAVPSGPTIVAGADDTVHLAYTAGARAMYRTLSPDGSLSEALEIAHGLAVGDTHVGAIAPLVYLPGSDVVSVVYRGGDGRSYERRMPPEEGGRGEPMAISTRAVAQSPVDSDQVAADAVRHGDSIHVLFVERETGRLYHAMRQDDGWQDAKPVVTGADVQWVRGQVIETQDGEAVYAFVYDAGSDGGSGMNRFMQLPLTPR